MFVFQVISDINKRYSWPDRTRRFACLVPLNVAKLA
jgi:hypothetical protein